MVANEDGEEHNHEGVMAHHNNGDRLGEGAMNHFDRHRKEMEVEDFYRDGDILEQGVVKIEEHSYIMTMRLRKISSNVENIRQILNHKLHLKELEQDSPAFQPEGFAEGGVGQNKWKK